MIRCLTKQRVSNNKAFSLVELMMAVAFSVLLLTGVYGFYNASSQSYASGISGQSLQTASSILLSKILEGATESGAVYRLATSVAYMIPNGTLNELYSCGGGPQTIPCNSGSFFSELYFCQDNPCTGFNDPTARWYYLSSDSTSIIYHHPAATGTVDESIFTAPEGTTLTLRFSPAAVAVPANVLEIDVALKTNVAPGITNMIYATSGSASTFVLLRNHP